MEHPISLNHAHIILEAVRLSTGAEITLLQQLIATNPTVLKPDIILRVLLSFLPESTDPVSYVDLLRNLSRGSTIQVGEHVQIPKPEISDDEANQRVRKLRLQPLADPHCVDLDADPLTLFLFHRARQIDAETGSLPLVLNLIKPFVSHSEWILTWAVSTLLPLLRLQYEYYPHDGPMFSLDDFEALDGNHAIDSLLSEAKREKREAVKTNIGRDLRGLIGPWIYGENSRKRRKLNKARIQGDAVPSLENEAMNDDDVTHDISRGWNHVNKWLLDLALIDFPRVAEAVVDWDGPHDVDYGDWASRTRRVNEKPLQAMTFRYAQAALAAVYATSNCSSKTLEYSLHILQKVVNISDLKSLSDLTKGNTSENQGFTPDFFKSLSPSYLLHDTLLEPQNPFTIPTEVSVRLCHFLLFSIKLLQNLARQQNCKTLAELSLFGDGATQLAEVRKILNQPRDPENWRTVRVDLLKLWNWSYVNDDQMVQEQENLLGVFCKIERVDLEIEILKALLHTSCYDLATETYCNSPMPISENNVEKTVLNVALACYDAASNGNRTRGGVRKASEIIDAFYSYFPHSSSFREITALISATHAMSFYSLTLQHGVPFEPVNIRANKDPISLIEKILDQNEHSYTKLDHLIEIGLKLTSAGIAHSTQPQSRTQPSREKLEQALPNITRRVTAMAIKSALAEDDFDTAYSYIVNRLPPPDLSKSSDADSLNSPSINDDLSWRVAYLAGCHKSNNSRVPSKLRRLEQRMELLSQALLLAPSSALSEILNVWRQCEEAMTSLITREVEEEVKWDDKGDQKIPGNYSSDSSPIIQRAREPSRNAINEEAPMGLFDVARGAAAALSKNAFPLRPSQNVSTTTPLKGSHERVSSTGGSDSGKLGGGDSEGRIRKRDMVSNMVTGGLASGIGWVIGAPSPRQE